MDPKSLLDKLKLGGSNDGALLQQMENMWKMLDDMAENDPDQYKSFVASNVKRGAEEIKKEKEKELEPYTFKTTDGTYIMTLVLPVSLKDVSPAEDMETPKRKVGIIDLGADSLLPDSGTCFMNVIAFKQLDKHEDPSTDHFEYSCDNNSEIRVSLTTAISEKAAFMIKNRCANWKEALAKCIAASQGLLNQKMIMIRKQYLDKHAKKTDTKPTELEVAALQL
jgi:hypothetical protein